MTRAPARSARQRVWRPALRQSPLRRRWERGSDRPRPPPPLLTGRRTCWCRRCHPGSSRRSPGDRQLQTRRACWSRASRSEIATCRLESGAVPWPPTGGMVFAAVLLASQRRGRSRSGRGDRAADRRQLDGRHGLVAGAVRRQLDVDLRANLAGEAAGGGWAPRPSPWQVQLQTAGVDDRISAGAGATGALRYPSCTRCRCSCRPGRSPRSRTTGGRSRRPGRRRTRRRGAAGGVVGAGRRCCGRPAGRRPGRCRRRSRSHPTGRWRG